MRHAPSLAVLATSYLRDLSCSVEDISSPAVSLLPGRRGNPSGPGPHQHAARGLNEFGRDVRAHEKRPPLDVGLPRVGFVVRQPRVREACARCRPPDARPPRRAPRPADRRRRSARCPASRAQSPRADARSARPAATRRPSLRFRIPATRRRPSPARLLRRASAPRSTRALAARQARAARARPAPTCLSKSASTSGCDIGLLYANSQRDHQRPMRQSKTHTWHFGSWS